MSVSVGDQRALVLTVDSSPLAADLDHHSARESLGGCPGSPEVGEL